MTQSHNPPSPSSIIQIGIIGAGRQTDRVHLPCLAQIPDVRVTALCDINEQTLQATAARHNIQATFSTPEEMLRHGRMDAVFLATAPTATFKLARLALQHGRDIFIEKPPAMNSDETIELAELAESKQCKSMVGFNRRFSPLVNEVKRLVEQEGPLVSVVSEFHTFYEEYWRGLRIPETALEFFIIAQTIHHIDLVRYLCGDMTEVHSTVDRFFGRYDDNIAALMKSEGGSVVNLISNFTTSTRLERLALYGNQIAAWLEGPDPRAPRAAYAFEWAKVVRKDLVYSLQNPSDDDLHNAGFPQESKFFIECLRAGREPTLPASNLRDAVKTMQLVERINHGRKATSG